MNPILRKLKTLYVLGFGAVFIASLLAADWSVAIMALIMLAPVLALEVRKGYQTSSEEFVEESVE